MSRPIGRWTPAKMPWDSFFRGSDCDEIRVYLSVPHFRGLPVSHIGVSMPYMHVWGLCGNSGSQMLSYGATARE